MDNIAIKFIKADDTHKVVECMIETRTENYYSPEFYDAGYLAETQELYGAFDESGRMAGFIGISEGLFNKERNTGCLLTVHPDFARRGIASKLLGHIAAVLQERGHRVVKGQATTGHTGAQTIVERRGWIPTGILYGARERGNAVAGDDGKFSLMLYTGRLGDEPFDAGELYIPVQYVQFAHDIYSQLNIKTAFIHEGEPGETVLNTFADKHHGALYMQAADCGADIIPQINKIMQANSGMAAVMTVVNIKKPSAVYAIDKLKEAGHRFCGFDPAGEYEHAVFYRGAMPREIIMTEKSQQLVRGVERI